MEEPTPTVQDRILDAARELFLTKGYNGSNLRDIARAAKVSMGGIYHHFGSKEDIYKALLGERQLSGYIATISARFLEPEFPENLGSIGADIFRLVRENKDFFKLLYIDVLEFQGAHVMPLVKLMRDMMTQQSETLLKKRVEAGELAPVHPAVLMRCMTDLFIHVYLEEVMLEKSLATQLGMSDEELANQMAEIVLRGALRTPK